MSFSVTRKIGFCYGHRLLRYSGKCKDLHGHNGLVEITLEADALDHRGMVMDFVEVKERVQRWIDAELDHKLILNAEDPLIPDLRKHGQPLVAIEGNPTAENIALHILRYAQAQGLPVTSVTLWETPTSCAVARPLPNARPQR